MTETIRLLIVDDHPVVRNGLRGMLANQPDFDVVGEAANGKEALALASSLRPAVVLMDLRMPEMDGVTATEQLKARWPEMYVLVLTTYDTDAEIVRAIEAGATSYILKDAPREELFQAVRATAQGQSYLSPSVTTRLMGHIRAPAGEALSARELEVLKMVAQGQSNKEIAHHLHISEATVKSHLLHIFAKLGVNDRTQAVTTAIQRGMVKLENQ